MVRIGIVGIGIMGMKRRFCLTAQGLDGDPVYLLDEFLCHRFQLLQDGGGFVKLSAGRKVLQAAREIAGGRRKLREQAAAFVSRFAQARRVLVTQRMPERGKVLRDAHLPGLAYRAQADEHWTALFSRHTPPPRTAGA